MLPKSMVVSFMALIMGIVEKIECSRVTLDLGLETSFMNAQLFSMNTIFGLEGCLHFA